MNNPNKKGATQILAHWAATTPMQWSPRVIEIAEHSLEDTIASAIAGAGDIGAAAVRASFHSDGRVPLIGGLSCASAPLAALANGTAAHSRELDEMFLAAGSHFGCAVIPAILSIADELDASLDRVLDALIVGTEVMARVGIAMDRAHFEKGWHGTQTIGVIAAAAACGRLLGLTSESMVHAISLAVSMAAGPKIQFGTNVKPVHAGLAAQGGVLAASMAAAGVQGSEQALEGRYGFGEMYAGNKPADWSTIERVGHEPLVMESHGLSFKFYPNCASTHRCLDALRAILDEHKFSLDDVQQVETLVGRVNMVNLQYPDPKDSREAMFSMQYGIATLLRFGMVSLSDFTPRAVNDAKTRGLMGMVSMRLDPRAENDIETATNLLPHTTIVTLKNGQRFVHELQHAKGTMQNPFTREERRIKFDQCTRNILPVDRIAQLHEILSKPRNVKVRSLMSLLQFEAGSDDGSRFCH